MGIPYVQVRVTRMSALRALAYAGTVALGVRGTELAYQGTGARAVLSYRVREY